MQQIRLHIHMRTNVEGTHTLSYDLLRMIQWNPQTHPLTHVSLV